MALAQSADGTLWAGTLEPGIGGGLLRLQNGGWKNVMLPGFDGSKIKVRSLFRDSHNALWIGTLDDGLYRIAGDRVDHFDSKEGLSADTVNQVFEDREGSVWVVTPRGLDQFHNIPVVSFGKDQGLVGGSVPAVATTAQSNEVWAGTHDGLYIFHADGSGDIRHVAIPSLGPITDLYRDPSGTMWVSGDRSLDRVVNGKFIPVTYQHSPVIGRTVDFAQDGAGDLWIITVSSEYDSALNHIKGDQIVERILWPSQFESDTFSSISANPRGGLWVNSVHHALLWLHNGAFKMLRSDDAGFGLIPDRDGAWAYPAEDALRLQGNEIRRLTLGLGQSSNDTLNMLDDGRGSLWLYMNLGLVQLSKTDLAQWWKHPEHPVPYKLFGMEDGVLSGISVSRAAVSTDGKVWFSNSGNSNGSILAISNAISSRLPYMLSNFLLMEESFLCRNPPS